MYLQRYRRKNSEEPGYTKNLKVSIILSFNMNLISLISENLTFKKLFLKNSFDFLVIFIVNYVQIQLKQKMGNKNAKNDDFSKNPNFNINQHQQAMRNLQNNYYDSNLQVNGGPPGQNTKVKQTEFKSVHRTASIYKPSINIVPQLLVSIIRQIASRSNLNTIAIQVASQKSILESQMLMKILKVILLNLLIVKFSLRKLFQWEKNANFLNNILY